MRGRSPAGDFDDIADPIGLPLEAYQQMESEIDPALGALAGRVRSGVEG